METTQEIIRHVGALSYIGIFGLSFAANVLVPVPEEVVILAMGYVVGTGAFNFWIALGIIIVGTFASDIIMFSLARAGNKYVEMVYNKLFAKIVPMKPEFVERHIKKIVFVSRFLVNLRFIGPFLAGKHKLSYKEFIKYDLAAVVVYISVLMWAGHYFANRIEQIFNGVNAFKNFLLILIGAVVLWSVGQMVKKAFFTFEAKGEVKEKKDS